MLAGAGLGDDALLAHATREQRLPEHVVDLVRTGVVEVLALEVDARSPTLGGEAAGERERAGPAGVRALEFGELQAERRVHQRRVEGGLQLVEGGGERLWHEPSAVRTEVPSG